MGLLKEFRDFAVKGNVIDLAVAVIIGAAFGAIVTSLVNDVLMPVIGVVLGGIDFSTLSYTLKAAAGSDPAVELKYGLFIQRIVDFLIIAFFVFMVIRTMNKLHRKQEATPSAPAGPSNEEKLLMEIRDELRKK
jgi:large conductance mechanosensitive channel